MKTDTVYLAPATHTDLPIVLGEPDPSSEREYVPVAIRFEDAPAWKPMLPALVHMAYALTRDAVKLGVEIEVVVDTDIEHVVVTRGREELLAAIVEAIGGRKSYANGILGKETINFGSMQDLDIVLSRALGKPSNWVYDKDEDGEDDWDSEPTLSESAVLIHDAGYIGLGTIHLSPLS